MFQRVLSLSLSCFYVVIIMGISDGIMGTHVEIQDAFGVVHVKLGSKQEFECLASSPLELSGRFVWIIGEKKLSPTMVLTEKASDGEVKKIAILQFVVKKEHHDKKLVCRFIKESNDEIISFDEDSLTLNVHLVETPESPHIVGEFEAGVSALFNVEFKMFPPPREEEVVWKIEKPNGKFELFTPGEQSDFGLYSVKKLKTVDKDVYLTTLMIVDIDESENLNKFFVLLGEDWKNTPPHKKIHVIFRLKNLIKNNDGRREMKYPGHNHTRDSQSNEVIFKEMSTNTMVIGSLFLVITIILILMLICCCTLKRNYTSIPLENN